MFLYLNFHIFPKKPSVLCKNHTSDIIKYRQLRSSAKKVAIVQLFNIQEKTLVFIGKIK